MDASLYQSKEHRIVYRRQRTRDEFTTNEEHRRVHKKQGIEMILQEDEEQRRVIADEV